jgi:serine/threonine protein kinase
VDSELAVRQRIARELQQALGEQPSFPAEIIWLEVNALRFWEYPNDYVWKPVYIDKTTRGTLRTTGEIVIPGSSTRRLDPLTSKYGIHFRKTFTADSPPLKRGESPRIERENTLRIIELLPVDFSDHLEPLGASDFVFRSRIVIGETFASISPFSNESYNAAISLPLDSQVVLRLQFQIHQAFASVQTLHQYGVAHGDLHLENILWTKRDDYPARPIDFGSAIFRTEATPEQWAASCRDDFEEFYREAGLLQLNIKQLLKGEVFEGSVEKADALFPPEIAGKLNNLGKSKKEY